jgi:hypothetical protein
LVFWSNMPARHLVAALAPHLALLGAQAAWRMVHLKFIPFFLGKVDAVRNARNITQRRKLRKDLAKSSVAPPYFPLGMGTIENVLNHLGRPQEASAASRSR